MPSKRSLVPFNPVERSLTANSHEIYEAINRVISSGRLILGPEVETFEKKWAKYCNAKYCVAVGNGTDAIKIALRAEHGENSDWDVLTVANSAPATVAAIVDAGCNPFFCDVDGNGLIDYRLAPSLIGRACRVVMPVHLYGQEVDPEETKRFARANGLSVIEDACQAHGVKLKKHTKAMCFSFYPTKNLGAIGDGGAIVTNHKGFAELCRRLRNYGFKERDAQHHWGYNSRLDELQAAVLSARLDSLDQGNIDRLSVGEEYEAGLESVDEVCLVRGGNHHIVGILCRNRSKLKKFLERAGIQTSIHYPIPAYRQLAYQSQFDDAEDLFLAGTESWCEEVLSLPCHPHMDLNEVLYVCETIERFYKKRGK